MSLHTRDLDPEDPGNAIQDEVYSSWALLILVSLLIATLWMSYYLQLKKIRAVHETVVSIFGGTSPYNQPSTYRGFPRIAAY